MKTLPFVVGLILVLVTSATATESPDSCETAMREFKLSGCLAAPDVLKQTEAGRWDFNHILITGVVDFSMLRSTSSHLSFAGSVFDENPLFGRHLPSEQLNFLGARVRKSPKQISIPAATLVNSIFENDSVWLTGARITETVHIELPHSWTAHNSGSVKGSVILDDTEIEAPFYISNLVFESYVGFDRSHFADLVRLEHVAFMRDLRADGAAFAGFVTFYDVAFKKEAFLTKTVAKAPIDLFDVHSDQAFLIEGTFSKQLPTYPVAISVSGSRFQSLEVRGEAQGRIVLSGIDAPLVAVDNLTAETVELSGSTVGNLQVRDLRVSGKVSMEWTTVGSLLLDDSGLAQGIDLRGVGTDRAILYNTPTSGIRLEGDTASLVNIESALRKFGQAETADVVFYQRKKIENANVPLHTRVVNYIFFDAPSGFGTMPSRTYPFAAGLVIVFGLWFSSRNALSAKSASGQPFAAMPFRRRLLAGLSYSSGCFFRSSSGEWECSHYKVYVPDWKIGRYTIQMRWLPGIPFFQWLTVVEAILSWLFLALFIATYTHVVLR